MDESKPGTNTVVANNKKVFRNGVLLAILGSLLPTCAALQSVQSYPGGYFSDGLAETSMGGAMASSAFLVGWLVYFILGVICIQLVIFIIFIFLNRRSVEISGARKWLFYAFELLVALTPFLIMWTATIV